MSYLLYLTDEECLMMNDYIARKEMAENRVKNLENLWKENSSILQVLQPEDFHHLFYNRMLKHNNRMITLIDCAKQEVQQEESRIGCLESAARHREVRRYMTESKINHIGVCRF